MSAVRIHEEPMRSLRGHLATAEAAELCTDPVDAYSWQEAQRAMVGAGVRPGRARARTGASLSAIQCRVGALLKALPSDADPNAQPEATAAGSEPPMAPAVPDLHTTDGHPIHLSSHAHDPEHHGMSTAGHKESAEVMRQAVKLLLHLRDAKSRAGDAKGALLFDREAREFLQRMDGHAQASGHKDAMEQHAAQAAEHGGQAEDVAREITGGAKDHLGIADFEQARAHPRFPEYVHHRHGEMRASEGVRHAGLAAMGLEGAGAMPLELNRFLEHLGHGYHGLADEPEVAGALAHDPDKARVTKSVRPVEGITKALAAATLRSSDDDAARIREIAARGGRARNRKRPQDRDPQSLAPDDPAQTTGHAGPKLKKGVDLGGDAPGADDGVEIQDPAAAHLDHAVQAADIGDDATLSRHALLAIEQLLGGGAMNAQPRDAEESAEPGARPPTPDGRAGRDADGDWQIGGAGQSDEGPDATVLDPGKAAAHDELEDTGKQLDQADDDPRRRLERSLRVLRGSVIPNGREGR